MKVNIETYIKNSGLRKGYIADKLKISSTQLSNVIAGRSFLRTKKLFKLAKLINAKVDDLYEWSDEELEE
ncbi:hypothetical protein B5V89_18700 [Heyndrickxia sporothermodurans]|nr:hypothetical protein B5V89_18700 [Heyndrickxia sporothermodurans]